MDGAPSRRIPRELDPVECRVLGCLMEKERLTPDTYPMSLTALVAACNQKSSRDPVMDLSEREVDAALDRLFRDVLVWRTDGARVRKWSHNLDRKLGLDHASKAALCLLLVRGPQTVGELRTRADRLHTFGSLAEVDDALFKLADPADPLVAMLPREPGRKEARWAHALGNDADTLRFAVAADPPVRHEREAASARGPGLETRVIQLEIEVAQLRAELARLVAELGGGGG
jgi:uncharacterized protein YceH (UPF0502 family)